MSDLDAILANLACGNIGKTFAIMGEFASSPAARVDKGCVADGRRSRMAKIVALSERIVEQRAVLRKIGDDLVSVQTRLDHLESPASMPSWMRIN
jgi:hypothetical protein